MKYKSDIPSTSIIKEIKILRNKIGGRKIKINISLGLLTSLSNDRIIVRKSKTFLNTDISILSIPDLIIILRYLENMIKYLNNKNSISTNKKNIAIMYKKTRNV